MNELEVIVQPQEFEVVVEEQDEEIVAQQPTTTIIVEPQEIEVVVQQPITQIIKVNQSRPGSQIFTGSGVPSNTFGGLGDIYIDNTTGDYYQKGPSVWVLQGNLIGGTFVDYFSRTSPQLVALSSGTITFGAAHNKRVFVQGNGGVAMDPSLPNGVGNDYLEIFVTSDMQGVELHSTGNLKLYGDEFIGFNGSVLGLRWDAVSQWVEVARNNVFM